MKEADLTVLIRKFQDGDAEALQLLVEQVYDQLKRIAHAQLGQHERDAPVNTTMIVHEAYLRLHDQERALWENRQHFMAVAATAMRQIIIDFARRQNAEKRGSGMNPVDIDNTQVGASAEGLSTLLDIDAALSKLASTDERGARLFELRFFGGMTDQEAADALGLSLRTAQREWRKVKAYFAHALG